MLQRVSGTINSPNLDRRLRVWFYARHKTEGVYYIEQNAECQYAREHFGLKLFDDFGSTDIEPSVPASILTLSPKIVGMTDYRGAPVMVLSSKDNGCIAAIVCLKTGPVIVVDWIGPWVYGIDGLLEQAVRFADQRIPSL